MKHSHLTHHHRPDGSFTRREFLKGMGAAAAGMAVAACQPKAPAAPAGAENAIHSTVAIAKADSYDPKLIRKQVESMLDGIGGIGDVLAHGNRVAIKTNLTGGVNTNPLPGVKEIDSYLTHPEVVKAVCELLRDAGVKDLYIVEAVYESASWPHYEYTDMAKAVGATLVDLNDFAPYKEFVKVRPSTAQPIYDEYSLHPLLTEIDAFVSISKMKCHNTAGVTHTMKNLFGIAPWHSYTLQPGDGSRTAFHGTGHQARERVPNIIVDLNTARRVNLSIIDGVLTTEGGEGPWISALTPIKAGMLLAGKDPVATDSVATAAMGFDPTADYPNEPFVNGINHLNLAVKAGLGTNNLNNIKVVGAPVKDVMKKFTPSF